MYQLEKQQQKQIIYISITPVKTVFLENCSNTRPCSAMIENELNGKEGKYFGYTLW